MRIKNFKKVIYILIINSIFYSCYTDKISDKSTNFTQELLFTKGIEGPAVDSKGNLFAVNFKEEGTIGKVDKNGNVSLFLKLPNSSIGNGIRFDKNDNMFIADYVNHTVFKVAKGTNIPRVYATDSTMNQPNDLAISPKGTLFLSDPNWAESTGKLWMAKNNKITLLEKNMGTTNGIEVSKNGKKLYVNESVQRKIWVYDINSDDSITNKKQFFSFTDFGLDGMRFDENGNLYVCRFGKGTILVLNSLGKPVREIQLTGKNPSNITFGGKNNKQAFVTMADRGCFETFFIE